jgi:hypothetical protein
VFHVLTLGLHISSNGKFKAKVVIVYCLGYDKLVDAIIIIVL